VYKFGDVNAIAHDFFQYYRLYHNWDWSNVNAPFNIRLVSCFLVHVFYKLNIFYNTQSAFDYYVQFGFIKQVYFSALLVNFIAVVITSVIIISLINKQIQNKLMALIGGLLYLLGFGTLF
jgi:hypothetical protein